MSEAANLMTLAGIAVGGTSIGGIETCIELPDLKLAFDLGSAPLSAVQRPTILFTHGHIDHMNAVAGHAATRALRGMPPPTYVVPPETRENLERLFEVWRRLDGSDLPHRVVPLGPGEEHVLPNKLVARPFRSRHRGPCQGYGIWIRRKKLLPEYHGLLPAEIERLRKVEGREVTHVVERCEVAFSGDCLIETFEREACLRQARLLILECTFVDDRVSVAECRAKGHVHLDEIVPRAALFENEAVLLTHFSSRYRAHEIRAALDAKLPASLRERVTPLLGAGF